MIQRNFRSYIARKLKIRTIQELALKIIKQKYCVICIQKKIRQIYAIEEKKKLENFKKYKEKRLNELKINQYTRKILKFLQTSVAKLKFEREEYRKNSEASRRRKGVINTFKNNPQRHYSKILSIITEKQSPLKTAETAEWIPNLFSIFRATSRNKNRPLTPSERVHIQTESGCIRRKSIKIKRNYPKRYEPLTPKIDTEKQAEC